MNLVFGIYEIACGAAFALCWLGGAICLLVVFVEAVRGAGTIGPHFVTQFTAQSRSGQLSSRSQRAMAQAQRFRGWATRAWYAGLLGVVVAVVVGLFVEWLRPGTVFPPPNHALQRTEAGGVPSPSP